MEKGKYTKSPWLTQPRATVIAAIIALIATVINKFFQQEQIQALRIKSVACFLVHTL